MWVGEESPLSPQGFGGRDPRKILIQNPTTPGNFLLYFKFKNLHTDAFLGPKMGTATVRKLTSKALWVRKQNRGDSVFAGGGRAPLPPPWLRPWYSMSPSNDGWSCVPVRHHSGRRRHCTVTFCTGAASIWQTPASAPFFTS